MRERHILSPNTVPNLPKHVRLQFDDLRNAWVVLAPERVLWPDDISVDILKRCDGASSIDVIVDALVVEYQADKSVIEADVIEFLQDWSDQRLLDTRT